MATNSHGSSSQLMLFEVEQSRQPDGSFRIVPKRVAGRREITVERALEILGFRDRGTIYGLLNSGVLEGWKPTTQRGNGKWRIYEDTVLRYKSVCSSETAI